MIVLLLESDEANENNLKHQNLTGAKVNPKIAVISSGKYLRNNMINSGNTKYYTKDKHYEDVDISSDKDTGEHFYLEIDESTAHQSGRYNENLCNRIIALFTCVLFFLSLFLT